MSDTGVIRFVNLAAQFYVSINLYTVYIDRDRVCHPYTFCKADRELMFVL